MGQIPEEGLVEYSRRHILTKLKQTLKPFLKDPKRIEDFGAIIAVSLDAHAAAAMETVAMEILIDRQNQSGPAWDMLNKIQDKIDESHEQEGK